MRVAAALLVLAALPGCNALALGAMALPAPAAPAGALGRAFVLGAAPAAEGFATADAEGPGAASVAEPGAGILAGAAAPAENHVRLLGVALVSPRMTGLVNVREGRVTGTALRVIDALGGRRLATAVTYYDGSFEVDVAFRGSRLAVVLALDLVGEGAPGARTTLSTPVLLQAGEAERRLPITPGSTALTSFLGAIAVAPAAGARAKAQDPGDLAGVAGPVLAGLIAGLDEDERDSFRRMAEASPELVGAADLPGLHAGIRGFVGRLTVPAMEP